MRRRLVVAALGAWAALAAATTAPARAQGAGSAGWSGRLVPGLWLSSLEGTIGLQGLDVPVADSTLHPRLAARLEVWRGHWGVLAEMSRASARTTVLPGDDADASGSFELDVTGIEAAAGFRVGRVPATGAVELLLGARYVRHVRTVRIPPSGPSAATREADWVDPFAGARFVSSLGGPARFSVKGGIGGWGVGSDLAWQLGGELGVRLLPHVELISAYHYSETEYVEGARYRWDGSAQGWRVGLGVDL